MIMMIKYSFMNIIVVMIIATIVSCTFTPTVIRTAKQDPEKSLNRILP